MLPILEGKIVSFAAAQYELVHTDCGNGKNGLYRTLWVDVGFAVGLHVNTPVETNVTHSSVAAVAVSVNRALRVASGNGSGT